MVRKRFLFIFMLFFATSPAYASVVISEIMYDLEGTDTSREWVEIQNNGPQVDLTGWKFFENGVNHGLVLTKGSISIPQNGFAIIADNAEKFLLDWPNFSGTLFDSSFSLSNVGENIILRDANLADVDSVSYSSDWGAGGDGKSLQKNENKWVSALPTPGSGPVSSASEEAPSSYQGGGKGGGENDLKNISGSIPEPKPSPFQAYAGSDRSALAGAEAYFEGQVKGVSDDMVAKARFLWNFGDGTVGEGRSIKHFFQYPGNYIVNLDVSLGAYSDSDSLKIGVSEPSIFVSEIKPGGWIEIKNDSAKIADMSGVGIQINDSKIFSFPKDTKISANSFLVLDSLILGFEVPSTGEVKILYPNGKILFSSKYESGILGEKESLNFNGEKWAKGEFTPGAKNSIRKDSAQQKKITPPLSVRGRGEERDANLSLGGGVTGEASVINSQQNSSFWSEIRWLIFGLGAGVLIGAAYLFIKHKVLTSEFKVIK